VNGPAVTQGHSMPSAVPASQACNPAILDSREPGQISDASQELSRAIPHRRGGPATLWLLAPLLAVNAIMTCTVMGESGPVRIYGRQDPQPSQWAVVRG